MQGWERQTHNLVSYSVIAKSLRPEVKIHSRTPPKHRNYDRERDQMLYITALNLGQESLGWVISLCSILTMCPEFKNEKKKHPDYTGGLVSVTQYFFAHQVLKYLHAQLAVNVYTPAEKQTSNICTHTCQAKSNFVPANCNLHSAKSTQDVLLFRKLVDQV